MIWNRRMLRRACTATLALAVLAGPLVPGAFAADASQSDASQSALAQTRTADAAQPVKSAPAKPAIAPLPGTVSAPLVPAGGSWIATGGAWRWRMPDGSFLRSTWANLGGAVYAFDEDGAMRVGWFQEDGAWYRFASSGARLGGWFAESGSWYFLDPATGVMATGRLERPEGHYLLAASGRMLTGWAKSADGWRFYTSSGLQARGWASDRGSWYFLDPATGLMRTGALVDRDSRYFLNANGAMATGWVQHSDGWRLYASSGRELFGWQRLGYSWYYLTPGSGLMVSAPTTIDGKNQSFMPNGEWVGYRAPAGYLQPVQTIASLGNETNELTWGMNGVKVKIVQNRLGIRSTMTLASVDANFQSAVRNFQRRAGLPQTGVVDKRTWDAMGTGYSWWVDQYQVQPISISASREERIEAMIGYAYNQLGSSYTWGGAGPYDLGFDCSGLALQAIHAGGMDPQPINVVKHAWPAYRTSQELYNYSGFQYFPLAQRQRGDLIFYKSGGVVTHVSIYLGGDQVIHTDWMGNPARISHITTSYGWGGTAPWVIRPFP